MDGRNESINEIVVLLPTHPLVPPAKINGIAKPLFVIRAHVELHRQALFRRNAAQSRVESHLSDRNAHSSRALIAQSKNSFAVAHDNTSDTVITIMRDHLLDTVLVGITDEQASRLAPDFAEALASFTYGRRIDDGQQRLNILRDQRVVERFIRILQIAHETVFAETRRLIRERILPAFKLLGERAFMWRQQSVERKRVAFIFGKRGSFIEPRIVEQVVPGKIRANDAGCGEGPQARECVHPIL